MARDDHIESLTAELGADASEMLDAFSEIEKASEGASKSLESSSRKAGKEIERAAKSISKEVKESAKKSEASAKKSLGAIERASTGLADALKQKLADAVKSIAASLLEATKRSIEQADAFAKVAEQLGMAVEGYSTLVHAARLSSVTQDELNVSLADMLIKLGEAQSATSSAAETFARLGVETKNSEGKLKGIKEILPELADAFMGLEEGSSKSITAYAIFGESGRKILPMLNLGREGIERLQQTARDLGLEISTEFARDAVTFNKQLSTMEEQTTALGRAIATVVLPELNALTSVFLQSTKEGEVFLGLAKSIAVAIEDLARASTGLDLKLTAAENETALQRLLLAMEDLEAASSRVYWLELEEAAIKGTGAFGKLSGRLGEIQQKLAEARDRVRGFKLLVEDLAVTEAGAADAARENQRRAAQATGDRVAILEGLRHADAALLRDQQDAEAIRKRLDEERASALAKLQGISAKDGAARRSVIEELHAVEARAAEEQKAVDGRRVDSLRLRQEVIADLTDAEKRLQEATGGRIVAPAREQIAVPGESKADIQRRREAETRAEQALENQVAQVGKLSVAQSVRRSIESGAFREFSKEARTRLILLAEEFDLQKEQQRIAGEEVALTGAAGAQIDMLREQLAIREQATQADRLRFDLTQGRFAALEGEQRTELEGLAVKMQALDIERQRAAEQRAARESAERMTADQERQAGRLLSSLETLDEKRQQEIRTITDLATVNEEVRGREVELIAAVNEKYDEMGGKAEEISSRVASEGDVAARGLQGNFEEFLFSPFDEGLDGMLSGFADTMRKMLSQKIAAGLFGGLGGGGSGGSPIPGLAGGGPVRGPGTSSSDSIPIMASDGEFMVRAAAVRSYGVGLFEQFNRMAIPKVSVPRVEVTVPSVPRYAEGGMVAAPAEQAAGGAQLDLAIVNVASREAALEALASRQGSDIIFNHLGSDGGHKIRRIAGR